MMLQLRLNSTSNQWCSSRYDVVFVTCHYFANCVDNISSIFHLFSEFSLFSIIIPSDLTIPYQNDEQSILILILTEEFASTQFMEKPHIAKTVPQEYGY